MDAERLDQELVLLKSAYPDLEHRPDGGEHWVRIPAYPSPGWHANGQEIANVELLFTIPLQDGQAPYGFYVRPALRTAAGGLPGSYTEPAATPWGNDFGKFSWTLDEPWLPKADIRAGANMLNFARSFVERLKDLS